MKKRQVYNREYYRKNVDVLRDCAKLYYNFHKEEKRKYGREYYLMNKEDRRQYSKGYREKNKQKLNVYREKNCERDRIRAWEKKYGWKFEDYWKMYEAQGKVCAICRRRSSSKINRNFPLCVDEDHKTGKIRGLLCAKCNTGIGLLGEDVIVLRSSIEYLEGRSEIFVKVCA